MSIETKTRRSLLQKKILIYLSNRAEKSITKIAKSIGHSRVSTSRALHKLEEENLILKSGYEYKLTLHGTEEYLKTRIFIPVRDYNWYDAMVCFDCPCGVTEIILSDDKMEKTCDCGRVYRFSSKLEVLCGGE